MAGPDIDETERKQSFALRWATSTPGERRALLREDRQQTSPQTARRACVLVALVFTVGGLSALVKAVGAGAPALTVGVFAVVVVLCGAAVELGRRGRTRLAFWVMVLCMLGAALVETFQR
jgi:hypothetical protein